MVYLTSLHHFHRRGENYFVVSHKDLVFVTVRWCVVSWWHHCGWDENSTDYRRRGRISVYVHTVLGLRTKSGQLQVAKFNSSSRQRHVITQSVTHTAYRVRFSATAHLPWKITLSTSSLQAYHLMQPSNQTKLYFNCNINCNQLIHLYVTDKTALHCCFYFRMPDCWLEVSIRKVLRPATSTQVFLAFPVSISKCWDGSQDSKLPLHASHVALPT